LRYARVQEEINPRDRNAETAYRSDQEMAQGCSGHSREKAYLMSIEPRFTESSGNVFADLGLPDAGTRLAKAELARTIGIFIDERRLKQREAARLLQIDQPKISAITRGNSAISRLTGC
jgi:predicted XRE-type DNA-binding protein